jgi:hypothetical protein
LSTYIGSNSQQNYGKYRYDLRGAGSFCIKPARELQFGHRKRGRPSGCRYGNRYTRSDRREKASPLRLRARRPDLPARAGGPSPQRGVGIAGRSWRISSGPDRPSCAGLVAYGRFMRIAHAARRHQEPLGTTAGRRELLLSPPWEPHRVKRDRRAASVLVGHTRG